MSSFNPYAMLSEDYEETTAKPQAVPQKQQEPAKKLPLKDQNGRTKSANKKQSKNDLIRNKPKSRDTSEFLEKPEHSHEHQKKPHHHRPPVHGRDYDRKSQTGKDKNGEKKEVAGHSWGDEVTAQLDAENADVVDAENTPVEEVVAEKDPADDFKSFADYLKEKKSAKVIVDTTVRQANEGVDDPKWKKLTAVKKDEGEVFFVGKTQTKERKVKEVKAKTVLQIEQTFAPVPRADRGDRPKSGGRGGNRGGRGSARGKRGGFSGQARPVNVQDPEAFPSLGK
ncbi:hypothetical protein BC833DRAFT_610065, partial [Globomyces pollinis-pini]